MRKAFHIARNPLPAGYRIFFELAEVQGVQFRRSAAKTLCKAKTPAISWRRDPQNPHDPNAIALFGAWKGWFREMTAHIGYVDRELASLLAGADLNVVLPRLHKTYLGEGDYVEITYQVIGPADLFGDYCSPRSSFEAADALRKSGNNTAAEQALTFEIARTEIEDRQKAWGVAPAPYLALAKLYRSEKRYADEVSILERYEKQRKAPGVVPDQLATRLIKARKLVMKNGS